MVAAGASGAKDASGRANTPDPLETIYDLLHRLVRTEEEGDAVDLSGLIREPPREARWAVLTRACVRKPFSHLAVFTAMQVAWGCAREVKFRPIDDY